MNHTGMEDLSREELVDLLLRYRAERSKANAAIKLALETLVPSSECQCSGCVARIRAAVAQGWCCAECGYHGAPITTACTCYEDWAGSCTPTARGPGCIHGAVICPVCEHGDRELAPVIREAVSELTELLNPATAPQAGKESEEDEQG